MDFLSKASIVEMIAPLPEVNQRFELRVSEAGLHLCREQAARIFPMRNEDTAGRLYALALLFCRLNPSPENAGLHELVTGKARIRTQDMSSEISQWLRWQAEQAAAFIKQHIFALPE